MEDDQQILEGEGAGQAPREQEKLSVKILESGYLWGESQVSLIYVLLEVHDEVEEPEQLDRDMKIASELHSQAVGRLPLPKGRGHWRTLTTGRERAKCWQQTPTVRGERAECCRQTPTL